MSYMIGLIVYKDSLNNWNEATNIAFINKDANKIKVISANHEQYARKHLINNNDWFEHYNHLRSKG